jgi:hypothetical protein
MSSAVALSVCWPLENAFRGEIFLGGFIVLPNKNYCFTKHIKVPFKGKLFCLAISLSCLAIIKFTAAISHCLDRSGRVWPNHQINILHGLPAGFSGDLATRQIAAELSKLTGLSVVVTNRLGDGGLHHKSD